MISLAVKDCVEHGRTRQGSVVWAGAVRVPGRAHRQLLAFLWASLHLRGKCRREGRCREGGDIWNPGTRRKPLSQCTFDLFSVGFHLSATAEVAEYLAGFASYLPFLNCTVTRYSASSAHPGKWRVRIQLSRCLTHRFSTSYMPKKTQQKPPNPTTTK